MSEGFEEQSDLNVSNEGNAPMFVPWNGVRVLNEMTHASGGVASFGPYDCEMVSVALELEGDPNPADCITHIVVGSKTIELGDFLPVLDVGERFEVHGTFEDGLGVRSWMVAMKVEYEDD